MPEMKKPVYKTIGIIFIIMDIFWLYMNIGRFYGQNFGGMLFMFLIPNKLLIINMILGLVCLFYSIRISKYKINIYKGMVINIVLMSLGAACVSIDSLRLLFF